MKKIYSFFAVALIALFSFSANATISVTVNLDNADAVTVTTSGANYGDPEVEVPVETGDNVFSSEDDTAYIRYNIIPKDGYAITSIVDENGTALSGFYGGTAYVYLYSYYSGKHWYVSTMNLEEARTASFTMTVDDPSLVTATLSGTKSRLDVQEGPTTYKFDPNVENVLTLFSQGDKNIYSITKNDETIPVDSYSVQIPLEDGCNIVVQAQWPDIPCSVSLQYDHEATPDLITGAAVNYENVDLVDDSFSCQLGDEAAIYMNSNDYNVTGIKINGEEQNMSYFYGNLYFTVSQEENVVEITAVGYGTITAIVNVTCKDAFSVYKQYQSPENLVEIVEGENRIELSQKNNSMSYSVNPGYELVSATKTEGDLDPVDISNSPYIYDITDGMVINLVGQAEVLDSHAVIWVDDMSVANYYFSFENAKRFNYATSMENGYTEFDFSEYSYNPFGLGWAGDNIQKFVFLNGEAKNPNYEGGSFWNLTIADGDVVKAFVAAEPVNCTVSIDAEEGVATEVTVDRISPVTDWSEGISCFNGTEVAIAASLEDPDKTVVVTLNDEPLVAGEDGKYVFVVENVTNSVSITTTTSGVKSMISDKTVSPVFNLQGIRIANSDDLNNLPAGVYVVDGKKVVVK
ncbi:MAG: hypothetical protein SPG50_07850 [Muribaculaceae bacterium]|nr:hypothetical protein [Muribaculaceae bacterium]